MASVRGNQIAQQMSAPGELEPAAYSAATQASTAEVHNACRSSNLSITQFL